MIDVPPVGVKWRPRDLHCIDVTCIVLSVKQLGFQGCSLKIDVIDACGKSATALRNEGNNLLLLYHSTSIFLPGLIPAFPSKCSAFGPGE
jgi:hypothetical protein